MSLWPWITPASDRRKKRHAKLEQGRAGTMLANVSGGPEPVIKAKVESVPLAKGPVRAALIMPRMPTTVQFKTKEDKGSLPSCVHALQLFTESETASLLADAKAVGSSIGWSDRGVSLPTQNVLVSNLSRVSQDRTLATIREVLLPFAKEKYPAHAAALDVQPLPRPGNLFIVRYRVVECLPRAQAEQERDQARVQPLPLRRGRLYGRRHVLPDIQ